MAALIALALILLGVWAARTGARRLGRATGRAVRAVRPAPKPNEMSEAEARSLLGVKPGASAKAVQKAYLRLIRRAHPDSGGTEGLASMLNTARDTLIRTTTAAERR
jgi:hypothetical protein